MKSRSLVGMARALVEQHGGEVPADMDALVKLPGVGRKTANVVLGHALGVPGLPVDRHVLRVANRIGLGKSDDPEIVEGAVRALPPDRWTRASDVLILHGRRICQPKPLCDRCARPRGLRVLPPPRRQGGAPAAKRSAARKSNARDVPAARGRSAATIPQKFRDAMQNIAIVVEDEPTPEQLAEVEIEPPDTLLGLYQGTPLTERQWAHGNTLPDKITLFQGPIEDESEDEEDVVVAIGETLIHEIGHYFGLSEEEIEEIEERYWQGRGVRRRYGRRRTGRGGIA